MLFHKNISLMRFDRLNILLHTDARLFSVIVIFKNFRIFDNFDQFSDEKQRWKNFLTKISLYEFIFMIFRLFDHIFQEFKENHFKLKRKISTMC